MSYCNTFKTILNIIGINPFVFIPEEILEEIFLHSGKRKGHIPLKVSVNGSGLFLQTLLRYDGNWRLYINSKMLKNSPKRISEELEIYIELDTENREIKMHPLLIHALNSNNKANQIFQSLTPSLKKEIVRYIGNLKSEESIQRNIIKAINFLLGNGSFVGRNSIPKKLN
ncbi:YdeI/OmpD-associated family protein [Sphingobacterium endophyticum]|uniref:YdeI/OmpD-associated family protein n=1 Tax=Sphingobacterium endophyticum TaxID=2546448 RepID=UPI0012E212B5|nr:YdeI/OmpD-associated family protein [Sphingobacterium endophyticum]